ncbi:nucleotide exchange factor Fes1-domain-containing protein [Hygrophoropsis aurantiaca]|uniref:Nucleotide exchange factor Fes1-domain-containing protein n=1 Tax=Hygrophoropsis aurantiaca TaxID=72124 RepID=A0ACB8ADE2_9AGAM|nr:nucleotide exchange factor Fes1-domain-containing protein [Hygrophoropsis aurantiaca]
MESLLRWGIENSTPSSGDNAPPPARRQDLDPAIIDHILGKPDAQLMKEALEVAVDDNQSDEVRVAALDDLEMRIENIDNANDLKKLKMWEPLQNLLTASSSTDSIKMQTLWVIGTALQNNPSAQQATRSKAMYALSGLLKHNASAVRQLSDIDGWSAFRGALEDSDINVRRKTAFLLNTLLMPTTENEDVSQSNGAHTPSSGTSPVYPNSHASMLSDPDSTSTSDLTLHALIADNPVHGSSLLDAVISALCEPVPFGLDGEREQDADFEENVVRLLHTYVAGCHRALTDVQKHNLQGFFRDAKDDNRWGLGADEFATLKHAIA